MVSFFGELIFCPFGSLVAIGGPAFMSPLHSASVLPALLDNLSPSSNPPQIVTAALQSLSNLTVSITSATSATALNANVVADMLFCGSHTTSLVEILHQSSTSSEVQIHISLASSLVIRLCKEEHHRKSLASAGALDALACRLSSLVMSQGMVLPGSNLDRPGVNRLETLPAPPCADLAAILEATAIIIADSRLRASQLVYSEAIMAVLPSPQPVDAQPSRSSRAAWDAFKSSDLSARQHQLNLIELQIPQIPRSQSRSAHALSFPPLGSTSSENLNQLARYRNTLSRRTSNFNSGCVTPDQSEDPESPLIAYLIWLAKDKFGVERLMAIYLLAVLYRAGLAGADREVLIGRVIIPMLVQIIELGNTEVSSQSDPTIVAEMTAARWLYQERAPAVLAMLVVDSEYLQKTSFDAKVIQKLSKMIKVAYDPVYTDSACQDWSPEAKLDSDNVLQSNQSTAMGGQGLSPLLVHKIKVRESALRAIAALVPFKEEYRRALIDEGVVPYIVESLRTHPEKPMLKAANKTEKVSDGRNIVSESESREYGVNPISVLIAACGAVRHLSRSVAILRTTFIDNGVVIPVFDLLQHVDIEVQIAATAAVCNLVTDFSPMREVRIVLYSVVFIS